LDQAIRLEFGERVHRPQNRRFRGSDASVFRIPQIWA
jgi:hypothetical protein